MKYSVTILPLKSLKIRFCHKSIHNAKNLDFMQNPETEVMQDKETRLSSLSHMCNIFCFRHWQDLGYLIIYITGRPDMQKQRVVSWLSQHNFPQGMIFFSDGLVHDPLRQKTIFLRNLMQEV